MSYAYATKNNTSHSHTGMIKCACVERFGVPDCTDQDRFDIDTATAIDVGGCTQVIPGCVWWLRQGGGSSCVKRGPPYSGGRQISNNSTSLPVPLCEQPPRCHTN